MTDIFGAFALLLMPTLPAMSADYDLAILDGRVMDPEAPQGFDEVYTNASVLGPPLLQQDNDCGWLEIEEKLQLTRDRGLNMWSENSPYDAGRLQPSAQEVALLLAQDAPHDRGARFDLFQPCLGRQVRGIQGPSS